MLTWAALIGGLVLLWFGGEGFVRGSVAIAMRLHLSQLLIGLTLVGFGTSLPELTTSVSAALAGAPGLAVGNVVGSNIANILLILAVAALIRPITARPEAFYRDAAAMAAATLLAVAFILSGHLDRLYGAILLAGLAAYLVVTYRQERRHVDAAGRVLAGEARVAAEPAPDGLLIATGLVVIGLAAVVGGAWLLVGAATTLAEQWGISKTFIGLTVVAVGTSLPELVITAVAALRNRADVALGNVMGSNLFNLLGVLGVTAMVTPINVPAELRLFDLLVLLAATAFLIVSAATRLRISRWDGAAMLAAYAAILATRTYIAL